MKLLYCHDNFYTRSPCGAVYSSGQFSYEYWSPLLKSFSEVTVVGRSIPAKPHTPYDTMNISSGPRVEFKLLPNINGPVHLAKNYMAALRKIRLLVEEADAVVVRAVSDFGWLAFRLSKMMGKPVAMELSACAWDSTWNHGSLVGKLYAPVRFTRNRIMARRADYTASVSRDILPRRYPVGGELLVASNVRLPDMPQSVLEQRIKRIKTRSVPFTIGLIGSLDNKLKGVDTALKAISHIQKSCSGLVRFEHLGPGKIPPYKQMASAIGIRQISTFNGAVKSGQPVLDWIDQIDLYIQPSLQEGLPRATLEAMSRGCPVISSDAGGLPEIVRKRWRHKPKDDEHLARLILKMLGAKETQTHCAIENFSTAQKYSDHILRPKRETFWRDFHDFALAQKNTHTAQDETTNEFPVS